MTADPTEPEDDLRAAELAFGLLDPEDQQAAQRRIEREPAFAALCERWRSYAAASLATTAEAPRPSVWTALDRRMAGERAADPRRRSARQVRVWQASTAASAGLAATLAVLLATQPAPVARTPVPPAPVVALLSGPGRSVVAISFDPATGRVTTLPSRLHVSGRSAELWIIPAGGKPIAVGLVPAAAAGRVSAPTASRRQIRPGATLAVSVEPIGGSRTGQPTGPVILTGAVAEA